MNVNARKMFNVRYTFDTYMYLYHSDDIHFLKIHLKKIKIHLGKDIRDTYPKERTVKITEDDWELG